MPWFRVDDGFHSHPKVLATSPAALGLWVVAGSWSSAHLTDGWIRDDELQRLLPGAAKLAEELAATGLWKRRRGGYQFHDWAHKNPSRNQVERARETNRQRQRAWQEAQRNGVTNGVTDSVTNSAPALPSPSNGSVVTEPERGRHRAPTQNPYPNGQSNPGEGAAGRHPSARPLTQALADAGVNGGKPLDDTTRQRLAALARQAITQEAADGT